MIISIPGKEFWYDWGGLNVWLFRQVNAIHGNFYDQAMLMLTNAAYYHNFPYYLAGLAVLALLTLLIRSARRKGVRQHAIIWAGVFAMLLAGFFVTAAFIKTSKTYFAYPRPYLVLEHVRVPDYQAGKVDDHHSFPSGHTAIATLLVIALWPVIPEGLGWLGILFIIGVAWSRMALGMHFPADVLASIVIMTPILLLLRSILYSLLLKLFGWRC